MRLTPNAITLLGLPLGGAAAFLLYRGDLLLSALPITLLGGCDLLDGYVAKTRGLVTPFGAFLDSTVDRLTELFLFAGILFFYLRQRDAVTACVTYWAMGGSLVISYTRARAENFIPNCRIGFWERPERIGLLLAGLVSGHLKTALWILAIGATFTLLHRIFYTRRALLEKPPQPFRTVLFRDYPRKSWPYCIYALVVVLLVLFVRFP